MLGGAGLHAYLNGAAETKKRNYEEKEAKGGGGGRGDGDGDDDGDGGGANYNLGEDTANLAAHAACCFSLILKGILS